MKAATPVEKDSNAHQSKSRKQKLQEPVVVPLSEVEAVSTQTQKYGDSIGMAGSANPNTNQLSLNNNIVTVHGSQTIYDQGSEIMHQKFQESVAQTGDINHPDTQKMEKGYMATLNVDQISDYQNLKSGTYLPKTAQEQATMAQTTVGNTEEAAGPVVLTEAEPVQNSIVESDVSGELVLPAEEDAAVRTTPADSKSDPQFNQTVDLVKGTAKSKRAHTTKEKAETHANAAAAVPGGERKSKARGHQVEQLDQQKSNPFKASDFKAKLKSKIDKMKLPANEKEVENFEAHNNIAQVNKSAGADVVASKNNVTGGIEAVSKQEPNEAKIAQRTATALPDPKIGSKVNIKATVPGKRGSAELSEPVTKRYKAVEQQFEKNNITDEQLANSNEPTFINALNAKKAAKENAENTPGEFKAAENKKLESSKQEAQGKTNSTMEGMHHSRKEMLDGVTQNQHKAGEKNTGKHQEAVGQLNQIYTDTKKSVDGELNDLETKVTELFDTGAKVAKDAFEKYVTKKTDEYKEKRYGSWYDVTKYGKRLKDAWNGKLPNEVNIFFTKGRQIFLDKLDGTINAIAKLVTDRLNKAKTAITSGRQKVTNFIKNLPADVKKAIKGDIDAVQGKFKGLENSINEKETSLIDSLATKYNNTLKEVDEMIVEFKKRDQGFLSALREASLGVWETIQNIRKTLTDLLSGAISVILSIIAHPIDFLSNLIDGVSQGFTNFGNNIWTHLKTGFFTWLTGATKGVSITMPEDVFSLKGIFSISMQMLSLTWGDIRAIGSKVVGEPVMKVLETSVETGFEIVQVIRKDGVAGLWEYLKDQFADLKETVMDTIMEIIQTEVIKAGIKWIMGLLTPVGAFIKAAMAIIDVVKFFIQKAAQIMELVRAFTESIKAIASGNVGAVAKSIENALGRAIPVLIGFLASLLGISGLAEKVKGVIEKIRGRIEKAITKFWVFVKGKAKGLLGKIGVGKSSTNKKDKKEKKIGEHGKVSKGIEWWNDEITFKNIENANHKLYFKGEGENAKLYMQSTPNYVVNHLNKAKEVAQTASEKKNAEAGITHYESELMPLNEKLGRLENERIKLTKDNKDGKNNEKITAKEEAISKQNKLQDKALEKLSILFKAIKFDDGVQPTTVKTFVTSKQDSMGRALEVEANPLTWMPGNTKGSGPRQYPLGWDHASEKGVKEENKIRDLIYIRGHLLNDNIHGPGVTWNLVPITRVMNSNMEEHAEKKGKQVLEENQRHRIMWYKTTIEEYHDASKNENDQYFPKRIRVEWAEYINKDGDYDVNGVKTNPGTKTFEQGKPAMPYNINDLGEKLLVDKLKLNPKFAKAITVAKAITDEPIKRKWFDNFNNFEIRMTNYYANRTDKDVFDSGMIAIDNLMASNQITF
jgi:hypothetical protein